MRKIFFKRHKLFFITFFLLMLCELILLHRYLRAYRVGTLLSAEIAESEKVLAEHSKNLPDKHMMLELRTNAVIKRYRQFISDTWLNITKREREDDGLNTPNNNIALFFEISDFVTRNRELCDSLGVAYDQEYAFGFKEYLNKKEQPLDSEIEHVHSQKEQIGMLLNSLIDARTNYLRIDSIKRGISQDSLTYRNGDVFLIDENRTSSDLVPSNVYQITFESFTSTFRRYLNSLRDAEVPVIIRGIEMQPYQTTYLNKQSQQYIVQGVPTKYTLTLEVLTLPNDLTRRYKHDARYMKRNHHMRRLR